MEGENYFWELKYKSGFEIIYFLHVFSHILVHYRGFFCFVWKNHTIETFFFFLFVLRGGNTVGKGEETKEKQKKKKKKNYHLKGGSKKKDGNFKLPVGPFGESYPPVCR